MERDRWHQMITIAVIASLVLAIVGIGIGIKALGKTGGTTAATVPAAAVVYPTNGLAISGTTALAAKSLGADVTAVFFVASGGRLHGTQIAPTGLSSVGWVATWNTTTVANGTYQIAAVAYDASGHSSRSSPVNVKIANF
jgi:hypothetical protein